MPNTWPCKLHGFDCPCRSKNCSQDHPGMCIYFDPTPASYGGRISDSGYRHSGPAADSIAAEHEDIFQWEAERNVEEGLGWGGGEY